MLKPLKMLEWLPESIVKSPLVKTPFSELPKLGRIVAAVGYSGASMDENTISVRLEEGDRFVDSWIKGRSWDSKELKSWNLPKVLWNGKNKNNS